MMENRNLSKIEIIVILLSAAFIPLMSLLIGAAIFSIFIDAPNMITQMYGERLFFAVSAVTLWYILNKINIIDICKKELLTIKSFNLYIVQILIIGFVLYYFKVSEDNLIMIAFFVILNYLIAWEEELVYRLLIPRMLEMLVTNLFIICLFQGLIFTYMGHPESNFIDNLIFRLPLSFILYFITKKTNSIFLATTIHSIWNIVLSYL
ncbi:hypothetical protein DOS83_11405 [Staphylococcus felis]|uniref:CAAX prenyl protease 2/Lysostaphin resistance protein A-like domain-containing protein n=3 Tax=Staphylococcus felis TaxID=46127 RepID=A0A3E0ILY7_9STAP|nr:CPBP family glutamic-type intramembrane protease [Staphylococcus felis]REH86973.1 hypothetical protein DOS61_01475 [Staphylococcus felis]REH91469.1 hypothetical protein DOS83_11405 [Staphylococcus felis]